MAKINLGEVKALDVMDDGTYRATFTEFKEFKAKSSGADTVAITFTIHDPDYPDLEGRKAWRNYSLQPQSLWALKQLVSFLGADEDVFNGEREVADVLGPLQGGEVLVVIGKKVFDGEERNEVRKVKPADTGESW